MDAVALQGVWLNSAPPQYVRSGDPIYLHLAPDADLGPAYAELGEALGAAYADVGDDAEFGGLDAEIGAAGEFGPPYPDIAGDGDLGPSYPELPPDGGEF